MQTISRVIVSLVYYNSLVRDTLEYTLPRDKYEVSFYDYKRNGIINEIKVQSPLKVFIDQNQEKGQALLKELEKFGKDFYSDESTAIKKTNDGNIRVDHAQNVKIFEETIPLHESLNNVIRIHEQFAEQHVIKTPFTEINGVKVTKFEDYFNLKRHYVVSNQEEDITGLPVGDLVKYYFSDGTNICIRPSGTEPKIKFYIEVVTKDPTIAEKKCDEYYHILLKELNVN